MKTVFDNRQCVHVWAQQTQDKGRSSNGNLFFDRSTIYSYGYHFPLAKFYDENTVFINNSSYSVSTSKHQSYVHQAVNHKTRIYISNRAMCILCESVTCNIKGAGAFETNILAEKIDALIQKAAKANKVNRPKYLSQAHSVKENAAQMNGVLGFDFIHLEQLKDVESVDLDAIKAAEKKKADELKAKNAALYETAKRQWLGYAKLDNPSALRYGDTLLRIDGDMIETSHGAQFPINHAKLAFMRILACRNSAMTWDSAEQGKTISLGHFKIDHVDAQGNVKAGCHFVKWEAIEHVACQLKIFP